MTINFGGKTTRRRMGCAETFNTNEALKVGLELNFMSATALKLRQLIRLERVKAYYLRNAKSNELKKLCGIESELIEWLVRSGLQDRSEQDFCVGGLLNELEQEVEANRQLVRDVGAVLERGLASFGSDAATPTLYGKSGLQKKVRRRTFYHAKV